MDKLFDKARKNADSLSFREFKKLMLNYGWILDHQNGSHQIWYSPSAYRLVVQDRRGNAKGYQVRQFLKRLDEERKDA